MCNSWLETYKIYHKLSDVYVVINLFENDVYNIGVYDYKELAFMGIIDNIEPYMLPQDFVDHFISIHQFYGVDNLPNFFNGNINNNSALYKKLMMIFVLKLLITLIE